WVRRDVPDWACSSVETLAYMAGRLVISFIASTSFGAPAGRLPASSDTSIGTEEELEQRSESGVLHGQWGHFE
ncbi:MAG: hypothetical protein KY429_11725, partial [Actinobacteria bacterium]|nr:hypothetical protein [Actinomycetota bacterium]